MIAQKKIMIIIKNYSIQLISIDINVWININNIGFSNNINNINIINIGFSTKRWRSIYINNIKPWVYLEPSCKMIIKYLFQHFQTVNV